MKLTNTAIQACTISLILLAGSTYAQSQNLGKNNNLVLSQVQQISDSASTSGAARLNAATNNYKPGI
ncbi:MAG: hypothetical protein KME29_14800 [Calothrix sp. FI2-JRJ7]|jgi:hypothetical protein|nr:hypothetical protein [Calothrix sp. FI2-JRJ7]